MPNPILRPIHVLLNKWYVKIDVKCEVIFSPDVRKHYLGSSDLNLAKADDLHRGLEAQADFAIIITVQFHVYALKVCVRRKKKHPECSPQVWCL